MLDELTWSAHGLRDARGRPAMTIAATLKEVTSGTRDHTLAGHLRRPAAGRLPPAGLVDTPQHTDVKEQATGSYAPALAARRYLTPWRDGERENADEPLPDALSRRGRHGRGPRLPAAELRSRRAVRCRLSRQHPAWRPSRLSRWSWNSSATGTALSSPRPARCGLPVPLGARGLGILNGGALRVLTSCDLGLVIAAGLPIAGSGLLPPRDDTDVRSRPPKPRLGVPRQEPRQPHVPARRNCP